MTLGEGIKAAREGDISAMMSVANYYWNSNSPTDALEFAEMAGEKGQTDGMMMSMLLRGILASASQSLPAWDDVVKHCEKMLYWARYILNIQNTSDASLFSEKEYDTAYEYALKALYMGGIAYWIQKDFQNAMEASCGLENARLQILHGISLFYLAKSDEELRQVFRELSVLESDSWYPNDADQYDDMVFTVAAQTLSMLYREKITGKSDLQHAHQVLISAYNTIKSPAQKSRLSSELSHYHMSRFGGFTYD